MGINCGGSQCTCRWIGADFPLLSTNQISTDGPDHNVLKIKPPMCFSKWDAELLARAIEQGLADYEEGG